MLLSKAPGPCSGSQILQWLRLPDSREWVAKNRLYKIESRRATFLSFATQKRRSPRDSGWNTARRMEELVAFGRIEPKLAAEFLQRLSLQFVPLSSGECPEKPLGIFRRSQKMSRLDESAQFGNGDQCHVSAFAPMNDDRLPRVGCFIEERLQVGLACV